MRNYIFLIVFVDAFIRAGVLYSEGLQSSIQVKDNSVPESPQRYYRLEIVSASSFSRALTIAEKLYAIMGKPTFITPADSLWKVQVGGFENLTEVKAAVLKLKKLGFRNLRQIEIGEFSESIQEDIPGSKISQEYAIPIRYTEGPITLDGVLDERAWKSAPPVTRFVQSEPQDRAPATERTEVRVLQDNNNIYFGFMCYDREPDKIVAYEMRRDAWLLNDDNISIYLDTYHDQRNFYNFSTNPLGCRSDAIVTEGQHYNIEWNGVWYVKTCITPEGWSAEIKIPFFTVRFKEDDGGTWGVNFMRYIRRKRERVYWIPIPRELGMFGAWRASLFGQIEGIKAHYSGVGMEIKPFAVGGMARQYRPYSTDRQSNQGMDVRYNFTPNVRSDFSYNTDFAHVESDQEIVNFTRFSLYLPEKREFFLENAGLFGIAGTGTGEWEEGLVGEEWYMTDAEYFYSRRIGLKEGVPIPLLGAAKISSRIGPYSLGVMNVQTREKKYMDDDELNVEPNTNFTAIRVKKDVLKQSNIGGMILNKQSSSHIYNRLVTADGLLKLGTSFQMSGNVAKTFSPHSAGKDYAGALQMGIRKRSISWRTSYLQIDPEFNPEMGFVRRQDIKQYHSSLSMTKWINNRFIRDIGGYISGKYMTNCVNDFIQNQGNAGIMMTFSSGDGVFAMGGRESERIQDAFDIRKVHVVPGTYPSWSRAVGFFSDEGRLVSGGFFYRNPDYWGGKSKELMMYSNIHPVSKVNVEIFHVFGHVDHPTASFTSNVLSNRVTFTFTPDLFARSYIQWNELDKRISVNFLVNYQYRTGSDFYLVYNEIWDSDGLPGLGIRNRVLLFKLTYLIRR